MDREPEYLTLPEAARYFRIPLGTLKAEANRGRLTTYKPGGRIFTTPNSVREMVEKCRVEQRGHGFTLIKSEVNGSLGTARASSALAAANETIAKLKSISRNTSVTSTSRNRRVHQ